MDIKLPIKIHNKFEIEVKDITSGEIVQKGYAENIVLDNYFTTSVVHSNNSSSYFGRAIQFGRGTGILDSTRTTLFDRIAGKLVENVEFITNQPPVSSYNTSKIVLEPAEYIGEIITEVGIGVSNSIATIYTHALIKDSEGNPLALEPKTPTQSITIYATVYFQPNFELGITLYSLSLNSIVSGFTGRQANYLRVNNPSLNNYNPRIYFNTSLYVANAYFIQDGVGKITTNKAVLLTSQGNEKQKEIIMRSGSSAINYANCFICNLETLAENNSTIWSGWEFDKTSVGVGDGSATVFNLTWDEAWLTKPYAVYVDNVVQSTGVTFNAGNITFDTAPADGSVITADYWVKYCPKDSDHELWVTFSILYGEGSQT